jgi:Protein of unknown function with PCYCGC motif
MNKRALLKLVGGLAAVAAMPRLAHAAVYLGHTPRGPVTAKDAAYLHGGETRPILDGRYFTGRIGEAYRAAAEIPDVLDQMYCYCECESSVGHKSLKSCFVDLHGANCGICRKEALLAWQLNRKGWSLLQIRNEIDRTFMPR